MSEDVAFTPPVQKQSNMLQKRKTKDLPMSLSKLTDKDRDKFELVLEIDNNPKINNFGKEFLVAKSVTLPPTCPDDCDDPTNTTTYKLSSLTIDNLRKLCKNIGIVNCGSHNKYNCRKAIATYFRYQDMLLEKGMKPTSHSSRITSTVCRAINVVFSTEFVDDFKSVNDRKTRQDHETRNTNKAFWVRAALAHNSCSDKNQIRQSSVRLLDSTQKKIVITADEDTDTSDDDNSKSEGLNKDPDYESILTGDDDFDQIIFPEGDVYLTDLKLNEEINLLDVDQFTTDAFRKKIIDLFKIRQKIKQNMNVSGTHDNEVWNFIEAAMKGFDTGFTKISVYYFYVRCELTLGIDSVFQPFLDPSLRGDSMLGWVENVEDDESKSKSSSKKRDRCATPDPILESLLQQGNTMIKHLAEAAEDRQLTINNQKLEARAMETEDDD
jgi:hypothetical protein